MRRQSERGKEREAGLRRSRPHVQIRAGWRCEGCYSTDARVVHHTFRRLPLGKASDTHELLVWICDRCHAACHDEPGGCIDQQLQRLAAQRLTGQSVGPGEQPADAVRAFLREHP